MNETDTMPDALQPDATEPPETPPIDVATEADPNPPDDPRARKAACENAIEQACLKYGCRIDTTLTAEPCGMSEPVGKALLSAGYLVTPLALN